MRKLPLHAAALARELDAPSLSRRGELYSRASASAVRCSACAHRCVIEEGSHGACGVRANHGAELRVPYGYVARRYVRSVETNTIFHLLPGTQALTFGMFGCDLRCPYCHNHRVSQALRDGESEEHPTCISAQGLVDEALAAGCRVLCAAYNEPMISAEWAHDVFDFARKAGLRTALVSDGHSTPEALRYMRTVTDVFRVDLKAHSDEAYRKLGGRLAAVLESIALARELGYWVEVVTLVVPGLNQERRAIEAIGARLRELDRSIPWHLNGFVPRYRLHENPPADPAFLMAAAGAAYLAGSHFVYVGNVPACAALAHTRCPDCHTVVIRRENYRTLDRRIVAGTCPECRRRLPGLWLD